MKVSQLLNRYGSDKCNKHSYAVFYDLIFPRLRELENPHILEIGVKEGYSLRAWKEYLPHASITGVDITDTREVGDPSIEFVHSDVKKWLPSKKYDLIIDDGSHRNSDIHYTLKNMPAFLNEGGFLIIEDPQDIRTVNLYVYQIVDPKYAIYVVDLRGIANRGDDVAFIIYNPRSDEKGIAEPKK